MSAIHRLVIPVPDGGWLKSARARDGELYDAWIGSAVGSATAAALPACRRLAIRGKVRPSRNHRVQVADDVRPSLEAVITGLVAAEVIKRCECVVGRVLTLGESTGECGALLVLELTEVG